MNAVNQRNRRRSRRSLFSAVHARRKKVKWNRKQLWFRRVAPVSRSLFDDLIQRFVFVVSVKFEIGIEWHRMKEKTPRRMKVNRSITTCGLNYSYVAWSNGGRVPIGDFISSSYSKKKRHTFFSSMRIGGFAQGLQRNFALLVRTIGCCLKILINGGSGDFFHTRNSGIEMWTNFQLTEGWCFRYCCLAFWNLKKNKKTILWSHATSTWRSEIWGGTTWQNVNRSPHQ